MFRVTSLTSMPEKQLNRLIKRVALLFLVGLIAFIAFYAVDRYRPATAPIADQKLVTLEAAVRNDPADVASRGQLADLYLAASRYGDAIAQYTAIIGAGKNLEASYASRGRAYELDKQLDPAKADYQKVVDLVKDSEMAKVDPTLELSYYGLGAIALQQNRPQDAVDNLNKALVIQRTDADAMNLLGSAYTALGQADKAIVPLRRATDFVPIGWAEPYTNLAAAYTTLGQADEATWASAMATLASGDAATAEKMLNGIAGGAAQLDTAIGLGIVMETKGDATAAAAWYGKALAIDPNSAAALLGRGRVGTPTGESSSPSSPASSPSAGTN